MSRAFLLGLASALVLASLSPAARAQTGVSSDRVSLPNGPGSLEGVGDNVGVNANMGLMSYQVAIAVPEGIPGLTPQLALEYSSGSGNSSVGIGWNLATPSIERMTSRGVPGYVLADLFAADGSGELVKVADAPPVYRTRCEGGFVRYSWLGLAAGTGAEGFWKAEYPDGRVGYFGADAAGTLVPTARVAGAKGTFRYLLVEMVDVYGHAVRYAYSTQGGNVPLVQSIGYVHDGGGVARFRVTFDYELRTDRISDAMPGVELLQDRRLSAVNVFSGTERLRSYRLGYETTAVSGGLSRLMKVEQLGLQDGLSPVAFSFQYSQALGAICSGGDCGEPYLVTMGSLGVSLSAGKATLLDLNGDALPDVVDASQTGKHRIFLSQMAADGTHTFAAPFESALGLSSGFALGTSAVQPLDLDGDGFTDLVNTKTGQVLRNKGGGDWASVESIAAVASSVGDLVDLNFNGEDSAVGNVRFLDFDNDRRIDVLQAAQGGTQLYANAGSLGFDKVTTASLGWAFDADNLDLADMNGDGLMDPVVVTTDFVSYRLNLGNGNWGPKVDIAFASAKPALVQLEDINGDSLADIVVVEANTVQYALNRNGNAFQAAETVSAARGASLPSRDATTTVLFADMNGNGSQDVVWVDGSGKVTYLELFPVRPNLLTRIENGLGAVTTVSYSTSVMQAARDAAAGAAWANKIPHPMAVVDVVDAWDLLTAVHETTRYAYHDAFYDGVDKQFRGFARVEHQLAGDATQEAGRFVETYDLGATNSCRHGLQLSAEAFSAGRPLSLEEYTYADCPLAGVPATTPPVLFACKTEERRTLKEDQPQSEWVALRTEYAHDGYGNLTRETHHGVTSIGGGACEACPSDASFGQPCGSACLGDEQYVETLYVPPTATGGRWMLSEPYQVRTWGKDSSTRYRETSTYYDGEAFVGLPAGQLSLGAVSRVTERLDEAGATVDAQRLRHDANGNVVESLDPNATLAGDTHRELLEYDAWGLRLTRRDVLLADPAGARYALRQEYKYDPAWTLVSEATASMLVEGGAPVTSRNSQFFGYDEFGRQSYTVQPGDSVEKPTVTYAYEPASPVSRVVKRQRSKVGGELDVEGFLCFDGRGRLVQTRTRLAAGQYLVSGFVARNPHGAVVRAWQPYTATDAACEAAAPQDVRFTESTYDAAGRLRRQAKPDAALYGGTASFTETVYLPLGRKVLDEEDTDLQGKHAGTPTVFHENGLGWVTQIDRLFAPGGTPARLRLGFSEHGDLTEVVDAGGHAKQQTYDLLGRVLEIADPNSGTSKLAYDAAGNVVSRTDARGVTLKTAFDAANRPVERWNDAARDATLVTSAYDRSALCPATQCTNAAGRTVSVAYPLAGLPGGASTGADQFAYDVRGQTLRIKRVLDGIGFEMAHSYDNAGRIVGWTFPDGRSLTQSWDAASRLVAVAGVVDAVAYTPRGELAQVDHHNGLSAKWTWDDLGRLSGLSTGTAAASLHSLGLARDRAGNVLAIEDRAKVAGRPDVSAKLTYDSAYRLLTAQLGADAETLTFAYDDDDDVTSLTSSLAGSPAHVGAYTYSAAHPNAVTAAGALSLAYDAAGNLSQRGALTFAWDHHGRKVSTSQDGQASSIDVYGPEAERVMRVAGDSQAYYVSADFEVRDGIGSAFVRVGSERVARLESASLAAKILSDLAPATAGAAALTSQPDGRIDAADAWLAHASRAGLLSLQGAPATSEVGPLLLAASRRMLIEARGETVYLHHDHRHSVTLATDGKGAVLGRRSYYPSGLVRGDDDGGAGAYGFAGLEQEEDSGLVRAQHRLLDPSLMRWASADPLFAALSPATVGKLGESTTAYAYVANNPEGWVDPTGLGKIDAMIKGVKSAAKSVGGKIGKVGKAIGGLVGKKAPPAARPQPAQAPAAVANRQAGAAQARPAVQPQRLLGRGRDVAYGTGKPLTPYSAAEAEAPAQAPSAFAGSGPSEEPSAMAEGGGAEGLPDASREQPGIMYVRGGRAIALDPQTVAIWKYFHPEDRSVSDNVYYFH